MNKQANKTHFFYQNGKLASVTQAGQHRAIFRNADVPLAEQVTGENQGAGLLEVDQNGSVIGVSKDDDEPETYSYTAHGHDPTLHSASRPLGFNGERFESALPGYLLGNGYRSYAPHLSRFLAPDNLAPFDRGGINAYGYCGGDPVNHIDPSGHIPLGKAYASAVKKLLNAKTDSHIPQTEASDNLSDLNITRTKASSRNKEKPQIAQLEKQLKTLEQTTHDNDLKILNLDPRKNSQTKLNEYYKLKRAATRAHETKIAGHWDPETRFEQVIKSAEANTLLATFERENPATVKTYKLIGPNERLKTRRDMIRSQIADLKYGPWRPS